MDNLGTGMIIAGLIVAFISLESIIGYAGLGLVRRILGTRKEENSVMTHIASILIGDVCISIIIGIIWLLGYIVNSR